MTSEEAKAEVANLLCHRFVELHMATRRRELIVMVRDPQILMEIEQATLCRSHGNQKTYLPTAGSFALINDEVLADRAKRSTVRTIQALQDLFNAHERDEPYITSDLDEQDRAAFGDLEADNVQLGLYLAADFGALGGYKRSDNGSEIESFTIAEHILSKEHPEQMWDDRMESARNQAKGILFRGIEPDPTFEFESSGPPAIAGTKEWYFQESARTNQKTPRCPFAQPDLCPRYFDSLSYSGKLGATEMDLNDSKRLKAKWRNSPPFALLKEQLPSVQGADGTWSTVTNFCPEVTYDLRGVFASMLGSYVDEIDRDHAHARLSRQGAPSNDPSWSWGYITALHYTSCPTFSVLAGAGSIGQGSQQGLLDALLSIPGVDIKYVTQQVERMSSSVLKDPALAIGTAKEMVETCCKTILGSLGVDDGGAPKLQALVRLTLNTLNDRGPQSNEAAEANKNILMALSTLVLGNSRASQPAWNRSWQRGGKWRDWREASQICSRGSVDSLRLPGGDAC